MSWDDFSELVSNPQGANVRKPVLQRDIKFSRPSGDINNSVNPIMEAFMRGAAGQEDVQQGRSVFDKPLAPGVETAHDVGYYAGQAVNAIPALPGAARGVVKAAESLAPKLGEAAESYMSKTGMMQHVVKPRGGNWDELSLHDAVDPLKVNTLNETGIKNLRERQGEEVVSSYLKHHNKNVALNEWIDTKLKGYLRNEMGTSTDSVRELAEKGKLHTPAENLNFNVEQHGKYLAPGQTAEAKGAAAKAWEGASDLKIGSAQKPNPYKAGEQMTQYSIADPRYLSSDLGFDHVVDELKNALNPESGLPANLRLTPEQLQKVTVPQAVERVAKINDWRAAQKVKADQALANNPATQTVKDYPDTGMKWVQLKLPKVDKLPEGYQVKPLEREGKTYYAVYGPDGKSTGGVGKSPEEAIENENLGYPHLESALKYEGDTMGHCVGGYCPDVSKDKTRIFSLRDKKGEPHVTVEVSPDIRPRESFFGEPEDRVVQIKGKGNKAAVDKYQPLIKDFLNSQEWGKSVGDLHLTNLTDTRSVSSLTDLAHDLFEGEKLPSEGVKHLQDVLYANNAPRFVDRSDVLKMLGLGGATGAAGAASAGELKGEKMPNQNWDAFSEPVQKDDHAYDMSEYSAPANEGMRERLQRKLTAAGRDMGLKAPEKGQPARITPEAVKKALMGVGEAGLSMATGAVATPVAGLVGLAEMPFKGVRGGAEDMRRIQQGLTYEPRTETGKAVTELANAPIEAAGKALGAAGGYVGEKVGTAMGGERGGIYGRAAGETLGELAPGVAATVAGGRSALQEARAAVMGEGRKPVELPPESNKEAAAIKAQGLGYVLPPSEARPSLLNRFITGYGGKIATEQGASIKNQEVTNRLVRSALGMPENVEISPESLAQVRADAGTAYQAIKDTKVPIYTNDTYKQSIRGLSKDWQAAERDFPELKKGKSEIADLQAMMDKPYISPAGAVEMVKELRSSATTNLKAFDDPAKQALGRAQRQAAEALDDLVEHNLKEEGHTELVADYRKARQVIAKAHDVESTLNEATGNIDAARLGKMLKNNRLTGYLKDVAEFAQTFKKSAQMPEKIGTHPGISPLDVATAGIEGSAALAAGQPGLAAGAVGTVLGRPVGRALGLSRAYQEGPASAQRYSMGGKPFMQQAAPALAAGEEQAQEASKIPRIELNGMAQ